jgi:uncharacterized protein
MIIDVTQMLKEPAGSRRHYTLDGSGEPPVWGWMELVRTDRGVFISGALKSTIQAICSRCLKPFDYPIVQDIKEEYLLKAEEGAFAINARGEIDLSEALRQYILLAVPMKPLCRPDCAGLCPDCGHDLNAGPCECQRGAIEPRLAPLAGWFKDGN